MPVASTSTPKPNMRQELEKLEQNVNAIEKLNKAVFQRDHEIQTKFTDFAQAVRNRMKEIDPKPVQK